MDFTTFYNEYQKLKASFPLPQNTTLNCEKSDFGDYTVNSKNVYYGFDAAMCEDSFYQYDAYKNKNCIDTAYTAESELCHETTDSYQCYNYTQVVSCGQLNSCAYCYLCTNCQDCFGCINLYQKQFCFFNKQLTEGEYRQKVAEYAKKDPREIWTEFEELRKTFPKPPKIENQNEQTDYGNYIYFNKNCYYMFDATRNSDGGFIYDSHRNKNAFDLTYCADNELCYELVDSIQCYESAFSKDLERSNYCLFSEALTNCAHCLGSVSLKDQTYCILNKQYTPEEYEKQKKEILTTVDLSIVAKKG